MKRRPNLFENADYDTRKRDGLKSFSISSRNAENFGERGDADRPGRKHVSAKYADNPMKDVSQEPTLLSEDDDASMLDRLHAMFMDAEISDDEIKAGIPGISDAGKQKIAARLGVSPEDVMALVDTLSDRLRNETEDLVESYYRLLEGDRFSFEKDYVGNVTIRDSETGDEKFVEGSVAENLLNELNSTENEQGVLARAMSGEITESDTVEAVKPEVKTIPSGFHDEIHSKSGTYNFPWKLNGKHGTGTVMYSGSGDLPDLKIVSVRDSNGDEMQVDSKMKNELLSQAEKFIGNA